MSTNDDTFMGDDVELALKMTNTSDNIRTISGRLALDTTYYTGVHYRHVDHNVFRDVRLEAGKSTYTTHF